MLYKKILLYITILLQGTPFVLAQQKDNDYGPLGYGVKLGVNYSMIGTTYSMYGGMAGGTLGLFFSKPVSNKFTVFLEPSFSPVSFRAQQSDTRYNNYYIDAGGFLYFHPSVVSKDFAFIGGIRPSYLLTHSSEVFESGNYNVKNVDLNKNTNGRIDFGAILGISVALSPVINFELIYNQSFTDQTTTQEIKGRASTVELNLRLNAMELKESLTRKQYDIQGRVENYHKGILLVMLPTINEKEVKQLRAERKTGEIEQLESELIARNQRVIREFSQSFSFCPVYYFMDTSIYKVISGNFDGIFVNKNIQPDTNIRVTTGNYFVASFCEDISNYTKRTHYGLYVYDNKMIQLEKPFNHPVNLSAPVLDGDPIAYLKRKHPNYAVIPYGRIITKFNTRLMRYLN